MIILNWEVHDNKSVKYGQAPMVQVYCNDYKQTLLNTHLILFTVEKWKRKINMHKNHKLCCTMMFPYLNSTWIHITVGKQIFNS